MSQFFQSLNAGDLPPSVPLQFVTNNGTAVPAANSLNIFGSYVAAFSTPVSTYAAPSNQVNLLVQLSSAATSSNKLNAGLSSFNSFQFSLDSNGYVTQNINITSPISYPYTVLATDYIISVNTSSSTTILLPNAPANPVVYIIKDITGNAAAANITITTPGGIVTIDGLTMYKINSNFGSVSFYSNGSNYFII